MSLTRVGWALTMLVLLVPGSTRASSAPPPHLRTVFLIVMENYDWSEILGNRDAPYINHTLLRLGASATRYYNPPGNHPSLPNYLWLEAGKNFGVRDDAPPSAHTFHTHAHLVSLLMRHHISWKAYVQGISGRTCPTTDAYPYAVKHNAPMYFTDITHNRVVCVAHERPLGQMTRDLARNRVGRYNIITPDLCHDMHDSCAPKSNRVRQGDEWLAATVPSILRSSAYRSGGALFITWDEGEGNDGPIGAIVLSPYARPGFRDGTRYTHSATLRTVEEILRVRPFLGGAAHLPDLHRMFRVFP